MLQMTLCGGCGKKATLLTLLFRYHTYLLIVINNNNYNTVKLHCKIRIIAKFTTFTILLSNENGKYDKPYRHNLLNICTAYGELMTLSFSNYIITMVAR